jgi:hypothetical protein
MYTQIADASPLLTNWQNIADFYNNINIITRKLLLIVGLKQSSVRLSERLQ